MTCYNQHGIIKKSLLVPAVKKAVLCTSKLFIPWEKGNGAKTHRRSGCVLSGDVCWTFTQRLLRTQRHQGAGGSKASGDPGSLWGNSTGHAMGRTLLRCSYKTEPSLSTEHTPYPRWTGGCARQRAVPAGPSSAEKSLFHKLVWGLLTAAGADS